MESLDVILLAAQEAVQNKEKALIGELETVLGKDMPYEYATENDIEWFVKRGLFTRERADKALDLLSKIRGLMKVHGQLVQADNALCMMGF